MNNFVLFNILKEENERSIIKKRKLRAEIVTNVSVHVKTLSLSASLFSAVFSLLIKNDLKMSELAKYNWKN